MRTEKEKKKGASSLMSLMIASALALSACSSGSESAGKANGKETDDVPVKSGEVASTETPEDKESSPEDEDTSVEEEAETENSGELYIEGTVNPDGHFHPFGSFHDDDEITEAEIDGLTFTEPVTLSHAMEFTEDKDTINVAAKLVGANEDYLILLTWDKLLYSYDRENKRIGILGRDVKTAYLDPVDNMVMFVVEEENSPTQHVYYVGEYIGTKGLLSSLTNVEDITMAYHEGVGYVTYTDLVNPEMGYMTDSFIIDRVPGPGMEQFYFLEDTSPVFGDYNGRPITYNPNRQSIGEFQYGQNNTIQIEKVTFKNDGKLIGMDMNEKGDHFYLLEKFEEDGMEANELYVNGKRVKDFQSPFTVSWVDDERLLVEEYGNVIYLYNTKKKEKHVIFDGNNPFVAGDTIVFNLSGEEIVEMKIKR